jgi:sarcosine oxidase, subunit gamma
MADHIAEQLISRGVKAVISVRSVPSARPRVADALGLEALPANNKTGVGTFGTCLWVRPDEWLVAAPPGPRGMLIGTIEAALGPDDGAVVDVSSSRIVLELRGSRSRDVLASCCPLDLHPRVFSPGDCAQSVIAKAPVLLHLVDDTPRWELYVRPSLVAYVVAWLTDAMAAHSQW